MYREFAYLYTKGPWPRYSQRMAEVLLKVLEKLSIRPETILDLACGEGTFAVTMAKSGFQMSGVDSSSEMLEFAKEKARRDGINVQFVLQDMRLLNFVESFDLVTCWYDSLNYLLKMEDLEKTFANVCLALKAGGSFIFDMNTIYGLRANSGTAIQCQEGHSSIIVDSSELFVVNSNAYDFEKDIATRRVIGFIRQDKGWRRIEETHRERGYRVEDIRQSLRSAGLQELACFGSLPEMGELQLDSKRLWFVAQKHI